ncbi:DNA polymerase IV [Lentilitoribacter sp. Alg239-R112]|uniref:DNA polymerase IV n=1 Tax=Lentilitoribacter sp. Alg239-R112 TaxID=2305987 RepID=UPI0013A6EBBE|nr:DNA polymerase IV [Lentilitoribacter sp. Alg239-R112]
MLLSGFCRDCFTKASPERKRCRSCGSPRILRHKELSQLSIAHIDCDAFYASVEKRDNPELADKPVIIGGGKRGVVSTACYVARIHGVRSAMPMFKALDACPDAVVIPPDMKKYAKVGKQVRHLMQELTPLVQPISIDEAFLDLSGTERLHGMPPAETLARFSRKIEDEVGISVSVGLSYCKYLAKVASDQDKPRGFFVVGKEEAIDFLANLPVTKIWGVGKAFAKTLAKDNITMIGQLQTMEKADLLRSYGIMGSRLYNLARGIDDRSVRPNSGAKSVSSETTFFNDVSDLDKLAPILRSLSEKVAARLKKSEIAGHTVVLKLKTNDFKSRTRNRRLSDPTMLADKIFRNGLELLKTETDGTKFRLLGIGINDLCDPEQADPTDLVDIQAAKRAEAEGAIDKMRAKFGVDIVQTGYTFKSKPKFDGK